MATLTGLEGLSQWWPTKPRRDRIPAVVDLHFWARRGIVTKDSGIAGSPTALVSRLRDGPGTWSFPAPVLGRRPPFPQFIRRNGRPVLAFRLSTDTKMIIRRIFLPLRTISNVSCCRLSRLASTCSIARSVAFVNPSLGPISISRDGRRRSPANPRFPSVRSEDQRPYRSVGDGKCR